MHAGGKVAAIIQLLEIDQHGKRSAALFVFENKVGRFFARPFLGADARLCRYGGTRQYDPCGKHVGRLW